MIDLDELAFAAVAPACLGFQFTHARIFKNAMPDWQARQGLRETISWSLKTFVIAPSRGRFNGCELVRFAVGLSINRRPTY
ncbi:MAG TPA: hypothetical protein VNS88_05685 [Nitrospiraceae bacterium]|nr:hypothetical protein [Nitrospiraceae bacterium]